MGTTEADALARYHAVIHLRTPTRENGYDRMKNPVRIESAEEAAHIDTRILEVWSAHPRRFVVESSLDFVDKLTRTLAIIDALAPACCRTRAAALVGE